MTTPTACGYPVANRNSFDEKYVCLSCRCLLKNPTQLTCGHRLCNVCVQRQNESFQCSDCSEWTKRDDAMFDRGFLKEMEILIVACINCKWMGPLKLYEEHLDQEHNQHTCSHCGNTFTSLLLLDEHKKTSCRKITVNCPFQSYGCKEQILRCDLREHFRREEHQRSILLCLLQLISSIRGTNQSKISHPIDIDMKPIDHSSRISQSSTTTIAMSDYPTGLHAINEMVDILSEGVQVLGNDVQRVKKDIVDQSDLLQATNQQFATIKILDQETDARIVGFSPNLMTIQQELVSVKQKTEEQKAVSFDGTLTWKIIKVHEKIIDAQSERQVSIYSPPFYSSPTGYKMCARLYLYGDGNARRTHLSLFFVLMRGRYDSLLKFPFNFKVSFCLYDQTVHQRHIIDSFRPDIKSNSFQRPRSEMNIASGIPKFISLSVIEQHDNPYVKDDTMFIKIMVDFGDMHKSLLPYAFCLNPGLPTHCQQMMIRQEHERKTLQQQTQLGAESTAKDDGRGKGPPNSEANTQQHMDYENAMAK